MKNPGLDIGKSQENSDAQLERTNIAPPSEAVSTQPAQPPQKKVYSESQARFEKILEQELSGTSFSYGVERKAKPTPDQEILIRQRLNQTLGKTQAKPKLKPLSKVRAKNATPFEGATVFDKIISFLAYLLKSLERFILGGIKRLLFRKTQQKIEIKPKEEIAKPVKKKSKLSWLRWSRM